MYKQLALLLVLGFGIAAAQEEEEPAQYSGSDYKPKPYKPAPAPYKPPVYKPTPAPYKPPVYKAPAPVYKPAPQPYKPPAYKPTTTTPDYKEDKEDYEKEDYKKEEYKTPAPVYKPTPAPYKPAPYKPAPAPYKPAPAPYKAPAPVYKPDDEYDGDYGKDYGKDVPSHVDYKDDKVMTEERKLKNFYSLVVSGAFKVVVKIEDKYDDKYGAKVVISAPGHVLKQVVTEVVDQVLYLRSDGYSDDYDYYMPKYHGEIEVIIYVKNLVNIEVNGASTVTVQGALKGKVIRLTANGSSRISTEVYCLKLYSQINGAGVFDLSGKAHFASIKIVGSGRYNAGSLWTEKTKIDVFGSADLTIWAIEKIFGTIEGSAIVIYKENPKIYVNTEGSVVFRKLGAPAQEYEKDIIQGVQAYQKSFFANALVDMS